MLKDAPKTKQLKTRDHKTQNVCGVKDTKTTKVFIPKQMYNDNSISLHVAI